MEFIKRRIFYYKSHENPYQVLQVTCNEVEGLYDKIIITIVPTYTGKNITRLLPLLMLCTQSARVHKNGRVRACNSVNFKLGGIIEAY